MVQKFVLQSTFILLDAPIIYLIEHDYHGHNIRAERRGLNSSVRENDVHDNRY